MTVAELLQRSRAAHEESKPRKDRARDKEALRKAAELRVEAFNADPEMSDPSWALDKGNHFYLLGFYDEQRVLPAPVPLPVAPAKPDAYAALEECVALIESGKVEGDAILIVDRAKEAIKGKPNV